MVPLSLAELSIGPSLVFIYVLSAVAFLGHVVAFIMAIIEASPKYPPHLLPVILVTIALSAFTGVLIIYIIRFREWRMTTWLQALSNLAPRYEEYFDWPTSVSEVISWYKWNRRLTLAFAVLHFSASAVILGAWTVPTDYTLHLCIGAIVISGLTSQVFYSQFNLICYFPFPRLFPPPQIGAHPFDNSDWGNLRANVVGFGLGAAILAIAFTAIIGHNINYATALSFALTMGSLLIYTVLPVSTQVRPLPRSPHPNPDEEISLG